MLPVQPEGPVTDQVTVVAKLPVPVTVAVNCCSVPMVAALGVTVIEVIPDTGVTGAGAPPPQADSNTLSPIPIQAAPFQRKVFMFASPPA
jgi:hypothetical protein